MIDIAALGFKIAGIGDISKAKEELDHLTEATEEAEKASGGLSSKTKELAKSARNAASMFAKVTGIVAGLSAALVTLSARSMDATAKLAQQAGITTEEYTKLTFAVQQFANVSDSQLGSTLRRMTRRIDEAARGTGAARGALQGMGLDAQELARLRPEEQFKRIADAIAQTEGAGRQLSYARGVFDVEGQALVTALSQGGDALEASARQAEAFGVILSGKAAKAAEHYMGNIGALMAAQRGFRQQITEQLLPIANKLTDYLVKMAEGAGEAGRRLGSMLASAATAADKLLKAMEPMGRALMAVAKYADIAVVALAGFFTPAAILGVAALTKAIGVGLVGAIRTMTMALMANPIGLLVAAIAAAGYAIYKFRDQITQVLGFDIVDAAKRSANFITNSFTAAYETIGFVWDNFGDMVGAAFVGGVNNALKSISNLIEKAIGGVNFFIGLANKIPGVNVSKMDAGSFILEGFDNEYASRLESATRAHAARVTEIMDRDMFTVLKGKFADLSKSAKDTIDDGLGKGKLGGIADGFKDIAGASGDASKNVEDLASLLDDLFPEEKLLKDHAKNVSLIESAYSKGMITAGKYGKAMKELAKRYKEQSEQYLPSVIKKINEKTQATKGSIKTLTEQVKYFGLSEQAIIRLDRAEAKATLTKLESTKATELAAGASQERIAALAGEIKATQELIQVQDNALNVQTKLDDLKGQKAAWASWAKDVKSVFDRVGQSLTDALFDGGKSGKQLIKDMFRSLVLRVAVQPVMGALQGMFMSGGGSVAAMAGSVAGSGVMGSMAQSAAFNLMGGFGGVGSSIFSAGAAVGSTAVQGFGVGMGMAADAFSSGIIAGFSQSSSLAMNALAAGDIALGLGAAMPIMLPIGLAIGAIISKAFGRKYKHSGVEGVFGGDAGFEGGTWDYHKGGWFRSSKTERHPLEEDARLAMADLWRAVESNIYMLADALSLSVDTLEGFTHSFEIKVGKKGEVPDDAFSKAMMEALQEGSNEMAKRLIGEITHSEVRAARMKVNHTISATRTVESYTPSAFARAGEEAIDTLQRLGSSLMTVNAAFDALELTMFEASLAGGDMASTLLDLLGGAEKAVSSFDFYYQTFFSESERIAKSTAQLTSAFESFGETLPDSHESFRSLVESIDTATESGRELFAMMMEVAPTFDSVTRYTEQMVQAFSSAMDTIYGRVSNLREQVLLDQIGSDEGRYAYFRRQAEGFAGLIESAQDMTQLGKIMDDAVRTATSAYGILDESQRDEMGGQFLRYLEQIEERAEAQADEIRSGEVEANANALKEGIEQTMQAVVVALKATEETSKVTGEIIRAVGSQLSYAGGQIAYSETTA